MAHDAPSLIEHVHETVPSYGSVEPSERAQEQRESRALLVYARVICSASSFFEGFIDGFVTISSMTPHGIYFFFFCVGGLFSGYLADSRGRLFAQVYLVFFVGLALAGVGVGVGLAANTMYFTEIVPKDIRGQFVALEEVSILSGLAIGYAASWFFSCLGLRLLAGRGICGIIAPLVILILLNMGFVFESPFFFFF